MNRRDFLKAIGAGLVALVAGRFTGKQRPRYINGTHAEMFFDAPEGECVKLEPLDMFAEIDHVAIVPEVACSIFERLGYTVVVTEMLPDGELWLIP